MNPILDELHETRRRLLEEAGGTLEGLVAGLQKRQRESGRKILKTQRTLRSTGAAKPGGIEADNQSSPSGDFKR